MRSPAKKSKSLQEKYAGSPWLEQLHRTRDIQTVEAHFQTDIAIIGAGIAGIMTAYFLLKKTKKRLIIIEAGKVAHGATGHNAGQLVSYFERPFADIVREFGLTMAGEGQRAVESAWDLLEEIQRDLKLKTPCLTFTGYAGCLDREELIRHLADTEQRLLANLPVEEILLAAGTVRQLNIPPAWKRFYRVVPKAKILSLLQTKDERYFAAIVGKKGCMNSAQFCEEVITRLLERFSQRLVLAELAPVEKIRLHAANAEVCIRDHRVQARHVILCTNGFERLHIENLIGANIDAKFHHLVRGSIGYMAAFIEEPQLPPVAISYFPPHNTEMGAAYEADPYFYVTRRPHGQDGKKSLVCIGGPEALLDNTNKYSSAHVFPLAAQRKIQAFIRKTYRHPNDEFAYSHLWHGLMGYTPNGIRCVGFEPCNSVLLYNLGCNGVGILPSIYGGFRIAQLMAGETLGPSIFDPRDRRCELPVRTKLDVQAPRERRALTQWRPLAFAIGVVGVLGVLFQVLW